MSHDLTSFAVVFVPKLMLLGALVAYVLKLRADVRRGKEHR